MQGTTSPRAKLKAFVRECLTREAFRLSSQVCSEDFFLTDSQRGTLVVAVGSEWRKCGFPITLRSCGSGGEEGRFAPPLDDGGRSSLCNQGVCRDDVLDVEFCRQKEEMLRNADTDTTRESRCTTDKACRCEQSAFEPR